MKSASEILESKGITLRVIGDELSLSPKVKVTEDIISFAKAHKKEIMAELQSPVIYCNPYPQGTPEARRESLIQVMDAIYQETVKQAREAHDKGELIPDPRIETVRQATLKGKAKLKDFRVVVGSIFLN